MMHPTIPGTSRKAKASIETVIRNRAVPPAILHQLQFQDCTANAVTQCIRTLREQGWLQSQEIVGTYCAYIPGRRAVKMYDLPPSYGKPLPRQPLEQNLGATLFCSLDRPRKRLLPREILSEFPWFPKSLARGRPFYFDHEDRRRLAMIRVELSASAYRIVKKHQNDLYKWNQVRPFRRLIERDEFMIVTITSTLAAAEKLADHIPLCHGYPRARVMAWPAEYLHLILSPNTSWSAKS